MAQGELKEKVRQFWNEQSCDTQVARAAKFSREYFEEIENFRYRDQPFIHAFAQFTRARGLKVLEVGVGAGTDFIQWLRAGALASGIDLTREAVDNVTHRIQLYGLPQPQHLCVADAENLPFPSNSFDLGYSFGVLHHSPDTVKAVAELVRVIRPGGELKMMLYNRHSIYIANQWIKHALLKGRPWKSLSWILFHHMESLGTKGYTRDELARWFGVFGPPEYSHPYGSDFRRLFIRLSVAAAQLVQPFSPAPGGVLSRLEFDHVRRARGQAAHRPPRPGTALLRQSLRIFSLHNGLEI